MTLLLKSYLYLPLAAFLLLGGGFFVCYGIGRSQGRYNTTRWPFVSDLGTNEPEASLFTLIVVWAAAILYLTMHSYYKYVIRRNGNSKINTAAWVIGLISCVGFTFVASFRWNILLVPHLMGAFATFLGGNTYSWLVVVISWRMDPAVHGRAIVYVRLVIAALESISSIIFIVAYVVLLVNWKYNPYATISEWIMIYFMLVFVSTLAYDLKNVVGSKGSVVIADDLTDQQGPTQSNEELAMASGM